MSTIKVNLTTATIKPTVTNNVIKNVVSKNNITVLTGRQIITTTQRQNKIEVKLTPYVPSSGVVPADLDGGNFNDQYLNTSDIDGGTW